MNNDSFDYYDDTGHFGNLNESEYYNYYSALEFIFHYTKTWKTFVDGHVYFVIVTLTLLSNCALIYGIVDRKCISSTTILLFSLALSTSVSCLAGLTKSVYLILWGNETDKPPDYWCSVLFIADSVGAIAISCGNWTTVSLGIQRCFVVFYPFRAARVFSLKRTSFLQICVLCSSILLQVYTWTTLNSFDAEIFIEPGIYHSCFIHFFNNDSDSSSSRSYFINDMIKQAILYVFPCILLTIATILLVHRLRKSRPQAQNQTKNSKRNSRITKATKFVLIILCLYLFNHILQTFLFGIYMHEYLFDYLLISDETDSICQTVFDFINIIINQSIFWIFVLMSNRFRKSIKERFNRLSKLSEKTRLSSS